MTTTFCQLNTSTSAFNNFFAQTKVLSISETRMARYFALTSTAIKRFSGMVQGVVVQRSNIASLGKILL